jgi:AcrR family transcriptional regulator
MYRSMQKEVEAAGSSSPASRTRGRPRAFDREAALDAAMRLFWCKGYSATSISDLTQVMGIGSPSLYAAFGSKEVLYAQALDHYRKTFEASVWNRFLAAKTARDAVAAFLYDSAESLGEAPNGCMVTLSAAGSEGHAGLGELVASARNVTLERLKSRIEAGVATGELAAKADVHGLARFVQTVQNGMSLLARDGATAGELTAVADTAMLGWDARVNASKEL